MAYPTQERRKSNFPPHVSLSGKSFFVFCTFTTRVLGLSLSVVAGASFTVSVKTCPSEALVPFVAMVAVWFGSP